jgi:hypothetical protein
MRSIILAVCTLLVFASCNSSSLNFASMTDLELAAYNQTVGLEDKVYCSSDIQIGSHIRKNNCKTVLEMMDHNQNQAGRISALSPHSMRLGF